MSNNKNKILSPNWNKTGKWKNPTVSTTRYKVWVDWGLAIAWNTMIIGTHYQEYIEAFRGKRDFDWLSLGFFAVGAVLIVRAWQQFRDWHYFGTSPLTMEPFPWTTGSHVTGNIELRRRVKPTQVQITLECTILVPSVDKDHGHVKSAVWEKTLATAIKTGSKNSTIPLEFNIPEDLPESAPLDSSDPVTWYLRVKFKTHAISYHRAFVIPVFEGRKSALLSSPNPDIDQDSSPGNPPDIHPIEDGIEIRHPIARNLKRHSAVLFGGVVFGGVSLHLSFTQQVPMLLLIAGATVSISLLLYSSYRLLNSYRVKIGSRGIYAERYLLGIRIARRFVEPQLIQRLELHKTGATRNRKKHIEHFVVRARLRSGNTVNLAEALNGRGMAKQMLENIRFMSGFRRTED
ncbi:hypothetical protein P886_0362 [Alteromonadaceae bacterium 2753L.S.0a.02]|nr:hypothetical protein P886_0362 [Alteromonadaceae bacterium 2753L.S.0a.02]